MIEAYVASAFCKNGTGGNKAGVVLQGDKLTASDKLKTAYQLGFSETAFVSLSDSADFKIEYFTPVEEVPLCGHATIGTFAVMNHLHLLKKPAYTIETRSGILNIRMDDGGLIFMEQKAPQFGEMIAESELEPCFRFGAADRSLPIQIVSTGLRDILYPVAGTAVLSKMDPDFEEIARISREHDSVGIHVFSFLENADAAGVTDVTAVCRNFAPLYGIDEESATGTSNCALACYLYRYGIRKKLYIFEQGYHLNSVSRIYVKVETEDVGNDDVSDNRNIAGNKVKNNSGITGVYAGGYGYLTGKKSVVI